MRDLPPGATARIEAWRTLALLGLCTVVAVLVAPFRPGIVLGESMAPTFHSGQVFLMSQIRNSCSLDRGDVVLFDLDGQTYLKRVYAIPGDTIWAVVAPDEQGAFSWVVPDQEVPQVQDVLSSNPDLGELVRLRVPDEHIVVLGDACSNSYDSRFFGSLSVRSVRGRVIVPHLFSLWAPDPSGRGVAMAGEGPATAFR